MDRITIVGYTISYVHVFLYTKFLLIRTYIYSNPSLSSLAHVSTSCTWVEYQLYRDYSSMRNESKQWKLYQRGHVMKDLHLHPEISALKHLDQPEVSFSQSDGRMELYVNEVIYCPSMIINLIEKILKENIFLWLIRWLLGAAQSHKK